MNKPMGVAQYQLTHGKALPKALQGELPTAAELSKEFPLLSVVKVRIEIERALNNLAKEHAFLINGVAWARGCGTCNGLDWCRMSRPRRYWLLWTP
jgi:hypothetical protein